MNKKLIDLDPRWLSHGGEGVTYQGQPVAEQTGVGISFDCPCGCDRRVMVLLRNPVGGGGPVDAERHTWQREGEDFATLSLTPSIQRMDGCKWHGFITNGEAVTV